MVNADDCYTMGWGSWNNDINFFSRYLQEVRYSLLDNRYCIRRYPHSFNSQLMLCCGDLNGDRGACFGDSGAPVICTVRNNRNVRYMIGLQSFGKRELNYNVDVLAKLSVAFDWITYYAYNRVRSPPDNPLVPGTYRI